MDASKAQHDVTGAVIAAIRNARFCAGPYCPHCAGRRIVGWGSFSDRHRYRCMSCKRTFSDLTHTPASYSKRLADWPAYASALCKSLSVRRSAAHVGIHRTTSFRWRHALLDGLRARDRETLHGWIEISSLWFAYSEKGRRQLDRQPRTHGTRESPPGQMIGAKVLLACDRVGGVVTAVTGLSEKRYIGYNELEQALAVRICGQPTVLAAQGRFGPCSLLARLRGGRFYDTRPKLKRPPPQRVHLDNVLAYRRRFLSWLVRFQGVATRYLRNYLIWHRVLNRRSRCAEFREGLPRIMALAFGNAR